MAGNRECLVDERAVRPECGPMGRTGRLRRADAFVSQEVAWGLVNADLTTLYRSTYLGGTGFDYGVRRVSKTTSPSFALMV